MFPGEYTLYGSKRSYFTAKIENILKFQGLPYSLVEKMPHDGSAIETRTGSGAIPALVTPEDWPLADSTPIAQFLNARYPGQPIIPPTPVQRITALILEDWFDEWFMRVAMYTRWNYPESVDALVGSGASMRLYNKQWHEVTDAEHNEIRPHVNAALERIASFRQRMTTEVAEAYGTTLEQGEDIMVWFGEFLDNMTIHLESHPYLLGERPCVADFVISGGYAAHFGNDTWPREFTLNRQPAVLRFAERLWDTTHTDAKWLANDAVPDTLQPFFQEMQVRYLPYLLANREALANGADYVEQDYGFGVVATPPRVYQELARLDLRDELLKLSTDETVAVEAVVPRGVLDSYLVPPIDQHLTLTGNKDTFPQPQGIGVLD